MRFLFSLVVVLLLPVSLPSFVSAGAPTDDFKADQNSDYKDVIIDGLRAYNVPKGKIATNPHNSIACHFSRKNNNNLWYNAYEIHWHLSSMDASNPTDPKQINLSSLSVYTHPADYGETKATSRNKDSTFCANDKFWAIQRACMKVYYSTLYGTNNNIYVINNISGADSVTQLNTLNTNNPNMITAHQVRNFDPACATCGALMGLVKCTSTSCKPATIQGVATEDDQKCPATKLMMLQLGGDLNMDADADASVDTALAHAQQHQHQMRLHRIRKFGTKQKTLME